MAETALVLMSNGHVNGHADVDMDYVAKDRFASGLILPPPEIKCEQILSFQLIILTPRC